MTIGVYLRRNLTKDGNEPSAFISVDVQFVSNFFFPQLENGGEENERNSLRLFGFSFFLLEQKTNLTKNKKETIITLRTIFSSKFREETKDFGEFRRTKILHRRWVSNKFRRFRWKSVEQFRNLFDIRHETKEKRREFSQRNRNFSNPKVRVDWPTLNTNHVRRVRRTNEDFHRRFFVRQSLDAEKENLTLKNFEVLTFVFTFSTIKSFINVIVRIANWFDARLESRRFFIVSAPP